MTETVVRAAGECQFQSQNKEGVLNATQRLTYLRVSLVIAGLACLALYPLMLIWPSGWTWHVGHSDYPLMIVGIYATLGVFLILAARNPYAHLSLIWFTVWSSVVHGSIMTVQALTRPGQIGHLVGDVPALFIIAILLAVLTPRKADHLVTRDHRVGAQPRLMSKSTPETTKTRSQEMKKLSIFIFLLTMVQTPSFSADKITLAILDLEARDVSVQEASKVSLLMRNEMQNSARLAVVEPELVINAMKGQPGGTTVCVNKGCAVKVGKAVGADKVLIGTVMRIGGLLAVTARMIDVETGTVDFAEKERALSEADEVYMVERFCDKVAGRMTGKERKTGPAADANSKMQYGTEYSRTYRPVKDPLAWISLGLGISSGIGFLAANGTYEAYNKFGNILDYASLVFLSQGTSSSANLQLLFLLLYNESRKSKGHAKEVRNTRYYVSASIGGAAVALLAAFAGRAINASTQEGKPVKSGDVSLMVPEDFCDPAPWRSRNLFNWRLGLTVCF